MPDPTAFAPAPRFQRWAVANAPICRDGCYFSRTELFEVTDRRKRRMCGIASVLL